MTALPIPGTPFLNYYKYYYLCIVDCDVGLAEKKTKTKTMSVASEKLFVADGA